MIGVSTLELAKVLATAEYQRVVPWYNLDKVERQGWVRIAKRMEPVLVALVMALEHQNHENGKCGCCWTSAAEKALRDMKDEAQMVLV